MSEQSPRAYGYARMPRIIRKGYKHLTKLQKLLYIYLRDLCGESGTCYRSLRTLAEETDFSIGFLSENIPALEQAGLIHAEKKKHNNKKWEIWHITIVDIWEENAKFLQAEKCSQDEQITNVHDVNCSPDEQNTPKSVHGMNENSQKCSRGANNREKNLNENPVLTEKESTAALLPEWFFQCSLRRAKKSKKNEEYWRTLADDIHCFEDMQLLYALTETEIQSWDDPTVQPGNLVRCRDKWKKARTAATNPIAEAQAEMEAVAPIDHSNEPLPDYMQEWMNETCAEFSEAPEALSTQQEHVSRLEWYYQRYRGSEVDFYNALLDAYRETFRKRGDITTFFAGVERRVLPVVEACVPLAK